MALRIFLCTYVLIIFSGFLIGPYIWNLVKYPYNSVPVKKFKGNQKYIIISVIASLRKQFTHVCGINFV